MVSSVSSSSSMPRRIIHKLRGEGVQGLKVAIFNKLFPQSFFKPLNLVFETCLSKEKFTVIQIGAHTGDTANDPLFRMIRKYLVAGKMRLICVEPVNEFFDKLVANYEGIPNCEFSNVAIAEKEGTRIFYRLGTNPLDHGHPEWLNQLGSLKKERMETLWDKYEANSAMQQFYLRHRIEESVQCITLEQLCDLHNVSSIDLLQMDVEGYELEILRTIDFRNISIRFINYESVLLHEHKVEAESLMNANGYSLIDHGQDTFCFKEDERRLAKSFDTMQSYCINANRVRALIAKFFL